MFCRNSSPDSATNERPEVKSPTSNVTAKDLFKILVPLIKCEPTDMRESIVTGLGHINPEIFRYVDPGTGSDKCLMLK